MRPTWPPVTRAILRCAPACWRCGLRMLRGLDQDTRRSIYHQALLRYIGCNADTHLLAAALGRRDHAAPRAPSHRHGQQGGIRRTLRPRDQAKVCRRVARRTGRGRGARPCRGPAGEHPDPVRALRGCAADRGAHRPAGGDPRKSRPDLRALGRQRACRAVSRATR